jgi:hypothetical protein
MPKDQGMQAFKDLFADFSALSICLSVFPDSGRCESYGGVNGHCNMIGSHPSDVDIHEDREFLLSGWKTLAYVPETITKTEAMCLEAVKESEIESADLAYVPEEFKTTELCLTAVKCNGNSLRFVPAKLKTSDLCLEAVKCMSYALQYVPNKLKTTEMCLEAVKWDCCAFLYIPDELKTMELCLEAVKRDDSVFEFISEEFKTPEISNKS